MKLTEKVAEMMKKSETYNAFIAWEQVVTKRIQISLTVSQQAVDIFFYIIIVLYRKIQKYWIFDWQKWSMIGLLIS